MRMKLRDLNFILRKIISDVHETGIPFCSHPMELGIWVDTDQKTCYPIVGRMDVNFHGTVDEKRCIEILRKINEITPISMIVIEGKEYHATKIEEYMKKPCGI